MPKTESQQKLISALRREAFFDLQFMEISSDTSERHFNSFQLVVKSNQRDPLVRFLNTQASGIPYELDRLSYSFKAWNAVLTNEMNKLYWVEDDEFEFGKHNSYQSIVNKLHELAAQQADMAETFVLGNTHKNREIIGIKIGRPQNFKKRAFWIDGGMHAREWVAIHAVMYYIDQLLSEQQRRLTDSLDFYIIPVANPDGYEYSRSSVDRRLWRKNLGPESCSETEKCCQGLLEHQLTHVIFKGSEPFSEPESRSIRDKILSPELRGRVDGFITVHSFAQILAYPYQHTLLSRPIDFLELHWVGVKAVQAMRNASGHVYQVGTATELVKYPSSGGSQDWAKLKGGVKYSYCLELPPDNDPTAQGFMLAKEELKPIAEESWKGVEVIIGACVERQNKTE